MAEHKHKLEIFRGRLKFKSNVQKIWGVLIFLSIVTAVEVALGILKHLHVHEWMLMHVQNNVHTHSMAI